MTMKTTQMIHWKMRPGIGKANRELARLTRKNRKQKEPDMIFVISKREIETGDFSRLRSEFSLDEAPEILRGVIGKVTFAISDYDDTSGELFEISEVRDYFAEVNCHWPLWIAFATLNSSLLRLCAGCVADNLIATHRKVDRSYDLTIPRNEVLQFYLNAIPLTSAFFRSAGLTPREIHRRLEAVAKQLGLV